MKILHSLWLRRQHIVRYVLAGGLALFVLTYRLGSIPGGLSRSELSMQRASASWQTVLQQPFYLPLTALQRLVRQLLPSTASTLRLPSVLLAFVTLLMLCYILRRWYGSRTAWIGFVIFGCSAWYLHAGRLADSGILYLWALPTLLAAHILLHQQASRKTALYIWLAAMALLLYIPGLVWLVVLNIVWQRASLKQALQAQAGWGRKLLILAKVLIMLAPLAYGFRHNPALPFGLTWLGLPTSPPPGLMPLKSIVATLLFVPVRAPLDPQHWLGRLPLLDAFMATMFVAGLSFYASHIRALRTRLLIASSALCVLLVAAGGPVSRSILVPLVYVLAAGGIAYVLHVWLKVFPRNPLAPRLGIGLVCACVALSCVYNLRQYFVAWPHNPDTVNVFSRLPSRH